MLQFAVIFNVILFVKSGTVFLERSDFRDKQFLDTPVLEQTLELYRCIERCSFHKHCISVISSGTVCSLYTVSADNAGGTVADVGAFVYEKVLQTQATDCSSVDFEILTTTTTAKTTTTTITTTTTTKTISTTTTTLTITTTTTTPTPTTTTITTAAAGCSNTPSTAQVTYQYRNVQKSWPNARADCQGLGGDLASITTAARIQAVKDYYAVDFVNVRTPSYTLSSRTRHFAAPSSVGCFKVNQIGYSGSKANSVWGGMRRSSTTNDLEWANGDCVQSATTWSSGHPTSAECGYMSPFENLNFRVLICSYSLAFLCEIPV